MFLNIQNKFHYINNNEISILGLVQLIFKIYRIILYYQIMKLFIRILFIFKHKKNLA